MIVVCPIGVSVVGCGTELINPMADKTFRKMHLGEKAAIAPEQVRRLFVTVCKAAMIGPCRDSPVRNSTSLSEGGWLLPSSVFKGIFD